MNMMKKVRTYGIIAFLAILCAFNYELFVFPNRFAPAGLNGICTMIQYVSGVSVGYMSLLINIPLSLIIYCKVSKPLAVRSMVYVIFNSITLVILNGMDMTPYVYATENGTSTILGPLVAGVIYGSCYSLLVQCSATTGGTDFVANLIHKARPDKNVYWLIFTMNVMVALASFFVYDHEVEPVILCILYSYMSSTITDMMTKSGRRAVRFEIVTEYPDEISETIIHTLHHSATLIPGKGMYLGKEVNILICIVNKNQMAALSEIVRSYPHTFAVMSQVGEVMGNFKKIDIKGHVEKNILDHG